MCRTKSKKMLLCMEREPELLTILVKLLSLYCFQPWNKVGLMRYTPKVIYLCNLEPKLVSDYRREGITSPGEVVMCQVVIETRASEHKLQRFSWNNKVV